MFADRAKIIIKSGKGGQGQVSFRRETFVLNGGQDMFLTVDQTVATAEKVEM